MNVCSIVRSIRPVTRHCSSVQHTTKTNSTHIAHIDLDHTYQIVPRSPMITIREWHRNVETYVQSTFPSSKIMRQYTHSIFYFIALMNTGLIPASIRREARGHRITLQCQTAMIHSSRLVSVRIVYRIALIFLLFWIENVEDIDLQRTEIRISLHQPFSNVIRSPDTDGHRHDDLRL